MFYGWFESPQRGGSKSIYFFYYILFCLSLFLSLSLSLSLRKKHAFFFSFPICGALHISYSCDESKKWKPFSIIYKNHSFSYLDQNLHHFHWLAFVTPYMSLVTAAYSSVTAGRNWEKLSYKNLYYFKP